MATTEYDIIRDEQERSNLLRTIKDVESAIGDSTPGTRRILENARDNALKRVATLDKKIEEAKVEHAAEVQAQAAAMAALAANEKALSASERKTYAGFLSEAYFTKKDFGKLDEFYQHGYDRLSEGGKDEMGKRIDEGIRRGEFKFSDLSETIQAKETRHRAVKASEITSERSEVGEYDKDVTRRLAPAEISAIRSHDFTSIDLSGIQISDAPSAPAAGAIPDASGSKAAQRSV